MIIALKSIVLLILVFNTESTLLLKDSDGLCDVFIIVFDH